jgi:hypothetical protein
MRVNAVQTIVAALLTVTVVTPAMGFQDWATRRSQPGVLVAVKAGEQLVSPGTPSAAVWADDTSTSKIDFWKCGPSGCGSQPNYWGYFSTANYPESYDSVICDTSIKTSGQCSFRITYPGAPVSHDAAYSTYSIKTNFTGPPRAARPQQGAPATSTWPSRIDARYTSKEWDPAFDPTLPCDDASQPAGTPASACKGVGNEAWVQARFRYSRRIILPYPMATNGGVDETPLGSVAISKISWSRGVATVTTRASLDGFPIFNNKFWAVIYGVTPSGYDKKHYGFIATRVDATHFTYSLPADPGSYVTGGFVTPPASGAANHKAGLFIAAGNTRNGPVIGAEQYTDVVGNITAQPDDTNNARPSPYNQSRCGCPLPEVASFVFTPDSWVTYTYHIKLGHWWRQNILGWPERYYAAGVPRTAAVEPAWTSAFSGSTNVTASTKTITRSQGSFLTAREGWTVGGKFYLRDDGNPANNGVYTIASRTATNLVVSETLAGNSNGPLVIFPVGVVTATSAAPGSRGYATVAISVGAEDGDILPGEIGSKAAANQDPITHGFSDQGHWYIVGKPDSHTWQIKDYNGNVPSWAKVNARLTFHGSAGGFVRRHWRDSLIELYMAHDGQPRVLTHSTARGWHTIDDASPANSLGWDYSNLDGVAGFAGSSYPDGLMVSLVRTFFYYNNRSASSAVHTDDAYYWFDELLVSTQDIADPPPAVGSGGAPSGGPPR